MITECYLKGRCDFGVGKCAVVVCEEGNIVFKVAWKVPDKWVTNGQTVVADQFNCEIVAATYALQWCIDSGRQLVNLHANTATAQKWYFRGEFPDGRQALGNAYLAKKEELQKKVDAVLGKNVRDAVYADFIPKKSAVEANIIVNKIAEELR